MGWIHRLARRRATWVVVLAVTLATRLAVVLTAPPAIAWVDGRRYEEAGWRMASEHRFTGGPIMAPGYPAFIAAVYSVSGRSLYALRLVEAGVSTATVGVIGAVGASLFGPGAGLLAAVLATGHPILAMLPATQYSENVVLFLLSLGLGTVALAMRTPRSLRFALGGLLVGLAMLCKPTVAAVLPGFALGAALRLRGAGMARLAAWAGAFALGVVCVVGPWLARNHAVHGHWFFTTKAGQQFWLGNNPAYRGATTWNPEPRGALLDSLRAQPDQFAVDRLYHREAMRFVHDHPGRALQLYLLKLRNIMALYPDTQTRTGYSGVLAAGVQTLSSLALYAGVLLGLSRVVALGYVAFPLGILSYVLVTAMYLTVMRYRMGIEVLLLWIAGLGWWWWLEGRRAHAPTRVEGGAHAGS